MIPFRLNQKQFRERYRRCLEKLSSAAIAAVRTQLTLPLGAGIDTAEIKIFVGEDDPYVPAVWIYYVGANNKVDNTDHSLFPGRSLQLLELDALEKFDERFYTDEDFSGLHIVADVLKPWFAECWWKAGGWSYAVPTSLDVAEGFGDNKTVKLTER